MWHTPTVTRPVNGSIPLEADQPATELLTLKGPSCQVASCFDGMHHRLPLRRRLSSEPIWNDHIARVAALTSPGAEEAAPKARCAVTKNSFVHTAPVLSVAGLAENCASPRRIVAAAPF